MTKNRPSQTRRKGAAEHPPLVSEIPACDFSGRLNGLPSEDARQPTIPVLESGFDLSRMLAAYDPEIHGGEAMPVKPVGCEIVS